MLERRASHIKTAQSVEQESQIQTDDAGLEKIDILRADVLPNRNITL